MWTKGQRECMQRPWRYSHADLIEIMLKVVNPVELADLGYYDPNEALRRLHQVGTAKRVAMPQSFLDLIRERFKHSGW